MAALLPHNQSPLDRVNYQFRGAVQAQRLHHVGAVGRFYGVCYQK
jgi:hypothetical protein